MPLAFSECSGRGWRTSSARPPCRRLRPRPHTRLGIADDTQVTVIELHTAEVLSTHHIDPERTYWRNTQKDPGRWPGPT